MSRPKPTEIECATCRRVAAFKAKADVLQEFIAPVLPPALSLRQIDPELTPRQRVATTWFLQIAACLKREMAPHPRCASCSILLGPGHLEPGTDGYCGTCWLARATLVEATGGEAVDRAVFGRRGWLSDHNGRSR